MNIPSIESLLSELDKVKAERDRFANMISESSSRWQEMMYALREAKESLEIYREYTPEQTGVAEQAIATINKVLGEE